jgi:hypothetical protein
MKKIRMFFDCFLNWSFNKKTIEEKQGRFDVILCLSFGLRNNSIGISNKFLTNYVTEVYNNYPKPLIIQKDCVDNDFLKTCKVDKIISKHQIVDKYLDSYEVSRQCCEYCKMKNFKTILIVAHPHHAWRVKKIIEKFNLIGIIANTSKIPYDKKSIQIWTRNKFIFILREVVARLFYLYTNKI